MTSRALNNDMQAVSRPSLLFKEDLLHAVSTLSWSHCCAALVRAVRGQGVILSSGARAAFELRGPYDAVNLATLLGLRGDQAQACTAL